MKPVRGLLWGLLFALPLWAMVVAFTASLVVWILP